VHVEFSGIELLRPVEVGEPGIEIANVDLAAAAQREACGIALIEANHCAVIDNAALTVPREQRIHQPAPQMGPHQVSARNLPRLDQPRTFHYLVVQGAV
jgi:hypothetical protein